MNLRDHARGRCCTIRLNGCLSSPESVVLAHFRHSNTGIGRKPSDLCGAWACSKCHDIVDGRLKPPMGMTRDQVRLAHAIGMARTLETLEREKAIGQLGMRRAA